MRMGLKLAGLTLALGMVATAIAADEGVTVQMTNHLVVTGADGKETLADGARARPGDILQYDAVYRNASSKPAKSLLATLPVPINGIEYIPQTAAPSAVLASIDGIRYETPPLKRTVRLADGTQVVREVPVSEYRFLRWQLGDLSPGASQTVHARMRIVTTTGSTTANSTTKLADGMKEAR